MAASYPALTCETFKHFYFHIIIRAASLSAFKMDLNRDWLAIVSRVHPRWLQEEYAAHSKLYGACYSNVFGDGDSECPTKQKVDHLMA